MRFRALRIQMVPLLVFMEALLALSAFSQTKTLTQGANRIEIQLERMEGSQWRAVDPGLVFIQNDLIRFQVKSNFNGYLYVLNLGTSGKYSLLFPGEASGRENNIQADKIYTVPATSGSFRITGPAGHEIVYWLLSPVELQPDRVRPDLLALPPPPEKKSPSTLIPRCDESMFRARGDCIDASAGARGVEDEQALPENLAGISTIKSRELSFEKNPQTSVVVAPESAGQPIIFEFRLAHR